MDIFDDDDDEVEVVSRPSTSASYASSSSSSRPLFLPDNDEEEDVFAIDNGGDEKLGGNTEQDAVDEVFAGVLAETEPMPRKHAIDFDRMEREAQKKAKSKPLPRQQILSSSPPPPDITNDASNNQKKGKRKDDGEQKERRKPMRLDEPRLVGPTGFPQLIEDTKHFRIRGKGNEVIIEIWQSLFAI